MLATILLTADASVLSASQLSAKLSELQGKYPTGTYYLGNSAPGSPYGGDWGGGNYQCWGFARTCFIYLWGVALNNTASTNVHRNANNVKIGDHVRYYSGTYNHSIIITNINGDTIVYADMGIQHQ